MNILHIITGLGIGGAERVVLDLSTQYKKIGHNVYVVSLSKKDDLIPMFQNIGVNPVICDLSQPIFLCQQIKKIISFTRKNNISIVHLHLFHSILISPFIYLFTKSKIVFTAHNFDIGGKWREFYVWALKPFRHVDILFSESQNKFFYKKKKRIIPNGIDVSIYDMDIEKENIFTFIAVGRLEKVKNHIVLIDLIYQLIHERNIQCKLQIVGDGILRKEIQTKIDTLNLQDTIELFGIRNDINELMNKAHCLLMPSLWEGLPIVLLEAAASKLPIISSNVGSIPTFLDENNSYICELYDFKEKMIEVINEYEIAITKANVLYERLIDHYSIENIAKQHILVYTKLL
jgi:glycosyltransferase involved in cell wall biosynthesis